MEQIRARRRFKFVLLRIDFPLKGQLARFYLRLVEFTRRVTFVPEKARTPDGLPLPPRRLRVLVTGTADAEWFLTSGRAHAGYIRDVCAASGARVEEISAILDFGCGCGRIARWFSDLSDTTMSGCDYNSRLVSWCKANLSFMDARKTGLTPPLPYPAGSVGLVYAFSVFTHLSVELATRWLAELHRLIEPGGRLWLTLHGASYRSRLMPDDRARFDAGEIVLWLPEVEGTNVCASYWPDAALRTMTAGKFEIVTHFDPAADQRLAETLALDQDAYLLRRI